MNYRQETVYLFLVMVTLIMTQYRPWPVDLYLMMLYPCTKTFLSVNPFMSYRPETSQSDGRTDRRTGGRTDGRTDFVCCCIKRLNKRNSFRLFITFMLCTISFKKTQNTSRERYWRTYHSRTMKTFGVWRAVIPLANQVPWRLKLCFRKGVIELYFIDNSNIVNKFIWQWKSLYRLFAKSWNGSSNIYPTDMFQCWWLFCNVHYPGQYMSILF